VEEERAKKGKVTPMSDKPRSKSLAKGKKDATRARSRAIKGGGFRWKGVVIFRIKALRTRPTHQPNNAKTLLPSIQREGAGGWGQVYECETLKKVGVPTVANETHLRKAASQRGDATKATF